jgi:predicted small secreted protein
MRVLLILAPALLLAGCGSNDGTADGTQISFNGAGGNAVAGIGKDGRVAIDVPGFKANIDLPKIKLDAGDFDINGVSLPTGSTISSMNITGNNNDDGGVRVAFASPVSAQAVRTWFDGKLAAKGVKLTTKGNGLTGTTDDGKAFTLTTTDKGTGASESVLTVGK